MLLSGVVLPVKSFLLTSRVCRATTFSVHDIDTLPVLTERVSSCPGFSSMKWQPWPSHLPSPAAVMAGSSMKKTADLPFFTPMKATTGDLSGGRRSSSLTPL